MENIRVPSLLDVYRLSRLDYKLIELDWKLYKLAYVGTDENKKVVRVDPVKVMVKTEKGVKSYHYKK